MVLRILGISIAVFASVMSTSMLSIAFPDIVRDLKIPFSVLQWRNILFFAVFAGSIPFFGKVADRVNPRKQLLAGIGVFILGCLGSALAARGSSWPGFLAAQLLVAFADAVMVPAQVSLIQGTIDRQRIGWAFGVFSSVLSTATLVGPPTGGILIKHFGWPSIFWVLAALAVVAAGFIAAVVPNLERARGTKAAAGWRGRTARSTALLIGFVVSFQLLFATEFSATVRAAGAAISLGCAALLFRRERGTTGPSRLFPGEMFGNPEFLHACFRIFLLFIVVNGIALFVPSYLRDVHRIAPDTAGWVLLIQSAVTMALGSTSGRLSDRRGPYAVMSAGIALSIAGMALLLFAAPPAPLALFAVIYLLFGLGSSLSTPAQNKIAMSSAPRGEAGNYMGVFQFLQFVSGAFSAGCLTPLYSPELFKYLVASLIALQLVALGSVFVRRGRRAAATV